MHGDLKILQKRMELWNGNYFEVLYIKNQLFRIVVLQPWIQYIGILWS